MLAAPIRPPHVWRSRFGRNVVLALVACMVGFGAAALPRVVGSTTDEQPTKATRTNPRATVARTIEQQARAVPAPAAATPVPPDAPDPAARTPAGAVDAFLSAERSGDLGASYGFLDAASRAIARSRPEWRAAHDQMPTVRGFSLGAVRVDGDRAEVDAEVTYRPELGSVVGLVPARATTTWIAVVEDGGWRVDYGSTRVEPRYPDEALAPPAARRWVTRHRGCGAAGAALLGSPFLVDDVCRSRGSAHVGAPRPLTPSDASDPFLAAFGPDVFDWARVVPLTAPVRAGAVVAPFDRTWRVIGLIDLPYQPTEPTGG